jgi:hypothetical protein
MPETPAKAKIIPVAKLRISRLKILAIATRPTGKKAATQKAWRKRMIHANLVEVSPIKAVRTPVMISRRKMILRRLKLSIRKPHEMTTPIASSLDIPI